MNASDLGTNNFTTPARVGYWIKQDGETFDPSTATVCAINGDAFVRQLQARLTLFLAASTGLIAPDIARPLTQALLADGKWGEVTTRALASVAWHLGIRDPQLDAELRAMQDRGGPITARAMRAAIAVTYYASTSAALRAAAVASYPLIFLRASDVMPERYPTATVLVLPLWSRLNAASLPGTATRGPDCETVSALLTRGVTFERTPPAPPAPPVVDGANGGGGQVDGGGGTIVTTDQPPPRKRSGAGPLLVAVAVVGGAIAAAVAARKKRSS